MFKVNTQTAKSRREQSKDGDREKKRNEKGKGKGGSICGISPCTGPFNQVETRPRKTWPTGEGKHTTGTER